jgi:hypothetical protein
VTWLLGAHAARWAWACRTFGGEPVGLCGGPRREDLGVRYFYGPNAARKAARDQRLRG